MHADSSSNALFCGKAMFSMLNFGIVECYLVPVPKICIIETVEHYHAPSPTLANQSG